MELLKNLSDGLARMQKDFAYLKNPSYLPKAYEMSLLEIKRRRKFRKNLDEDFKRMKQNIEDESA